MHDFSSLKMGCTSLEATLLYLPAGYDCVDLSLYKVKYLDLQYTLF